MRKESLQFLEAFLNTPTPSGFEGPGAALWREYVAPYADTVRGDVYGNSIATLNPEGSPRVMLAGHIDEIGFMVTYINDDGFAYLSAIGGVDAAVAVSKPVIIHGAKGPVPGVLGRKAIHMTDAEERGKPLKLHEVYVDIGAKSKAEAKRSIAIGDAVVFDIGYRKLVGNRIAARGCDDRIGAWAVAEALRILSSSRRLKAAVYGVATVQEENGAFGAAIAATAIEPKAAIAVDVTQSVDTPDSRKERFGETRLGLGPALSIGSVISPKMRELMIKAAERKKIPVQFDTTPRRSGTDADAIFSKCGGVATGLISIPNRYMHTPVEVVDLKDLEQTAALLAATCEEITDKVDFTR